MRADAQSCTTAAAGVGIHSTAMQRVLVIPELLDMIFSYLDRTSNSANAVVCRRWSSIALDTLWREVNDIQQLLKLLAPLKVTGETEWSFERPLESPDWLRFDNYAKRVRRLVFTTPPNKGSYRSVFDDMGRTRTRLEIFPNLISLSWFGPLNLSVTFMHKGVKEFTFDVGTYGDVQAEGLESFFTDVVHRLPSLTTLDVRSVTPARLIEGSLVGLLQQLPKLQKVTFPRFYLTSKIAEAVSRLDDLGVLQFEYWDWQGKGDLADIASFGPTLTEGAFPSLWDFSITVSFEDATRFLASPFSPTNLTILYIDSEWMSTASAIHALLNAIAENCQGLKLLSLVSLRDSEIPLDPVPSASPTPTPQGERTASSFLDSIAPECAITLSVLKPILKLPNLTIFEIFHHYPLALSQHDLETLASQWPCMEKLFLNNEPACFGYSPLTLDALIPFAKYCPNLTSLGLFLDGSTTRKHSLHPSLPSSTPLASTSSPSRSTSTSTSATSSSSIPTFRSLRSLSVGSSILGASSETATALALSLILPSGCSVEYGVTWDDKQRPDIDLVRELGERCESWTQVSELLPMLIQLRMEERERTKMLEREMHDLRIRAGVRDVSGANSSGDGSLTRSWIKKVRRFIPQF